MMNYIGKLELQLTIIEETHSGPKMKIVRQKL